MHGHASILVLLLERRGFGRGAPGLCATLLATGEAPISPVEVVPDTFVLNHDRTNLAIYAGPDTLDHATPRRSPCALEGTAACTAELHSHQAW